MDIVGFLSITAVQNKFLLVAINSFSKWVEVETYASIKDKNVSKFVWKNIMCLFRVPWAIVADNGQQFDSIVFRTFCSDLNIKNLYSMPRYPQSNEQVEVTNKTLLVVLKKMLEWAKGKWADELSRVLWAYRTTSRRPTKATHFVISYRLLFQSKKACIPPKRSCKVKKTMIRNLKNTWTRQMKYGKRGYSDGFLPLESNCSLQQKSVATIFPDRNPSPQKSLREHCWIRNRKALG